MTRFINHLLTILLISLPITGFAWDNNELDSAWRQGDSANLLQASKADEFSGWYAHYRLAMISLDTDDKKQAKASLDTIKKALKKNYQSADEAALYSIATGLSIALKPWQAAFIAGAAEDALDYCKAQSTDHAPCYLVEGTAQFNTPAFLGGDRTEALLSFEKAIKLYQQSEAWGYEDALLWRVKTLLALDQIDAARSARQALLQQYPDFVDAQQLDF